MVWQYFKIDAEVEKDHEAIHCSITTCVIREATCVAVINDDYRGSLAYIDVG